MGTSSRKCRLAAAGSLMLLGCVSLARADEDSAALPDLKRLSIEELSALEISSVSRAPEPVSGAAAAIYVITGEDVRRSGATTLAEILRLAPNLQVARIDAGDYAISARGFNNTVANKLLVLVDGRTVYTPLYSGVFWDMQNVAPNTIERIEVISGPGGTLWGSNAVNGVINVVSRDSSATPGAMLRLSGGNADVNGMAQYGGGLGDSLTYRVYGGGLRQGHTLTAAQLSGQDSWDLYQGGFRTDWKSEADKVTVQGDLARGDNRPIAGTHIGLNSGNILGRWQRQIDAGSAIELQAYYDHAARAVDAGIHDSLDTYDLSAQHSFMLGSVQRIVWGGGTRLTRDNLIPGLHTSFLIPAARTLRLSNIFLSDTIAVTSSVKLALGLKWEHNSYTGAEWMPDARLSWQVNPDVVLWAAASRAMRTPSRFDRDLYNTGLLAGGPDFQSEELTAYEAGTRARLSRNATLSVSLFYNVYDHLRTAELPFPLTLANLMQGKTYGVEAWATYEPLSWWRVKAGGMVMHEDLRLKPGSLSFFGIAAEGNDPSNQFSVRSEMNLAQDVELDLAVRAVGSLPNPRVPAYAAADARIGWNISEQVQLSLSGLNLLNDHHPEFVATSPPRRDMRRTVYATARWSM